MPYFVLRLTLQNITLYAADRDEIRKIPLDAIVPQTLEEVVGADYAERFLQFRTGQSGSGVAAFHGHGEGKDDRKEEVLKFCRAVDKGLSAYLHEKEAPLVIAASTYIGAIYREIASYPHLLDANLAGNWEHQPDHELHAASWELIAGQLTARQKEATNQYQELIHTLKTSEDLRDIVPAALHGRIETLFINRQAEDWGLYDEVHDQVITEKQRRPRHGSLTDLAAMKTFLQGGQVYFVAPGEMPVPQTHMNAIFRY
jgi:hypothetical protein